MLNKLTGISITLVVEAKEAKEAKETKNINASSGQYQMKIDGKQYQFTFKNTKINEMQKNEKKLIIITESHIETECNIPSKSEIMKEDCKFENCIMYLSNSETKNIKIIDGSMRFEDGHIFIMPEQLLRTLQDTLIVM